MVWDELVSSAYALPPRISGNPVPYRDPKIGSKLHSESDQLVETFSMPDHLTDSVGISDQLVDRTGMSVQLVDEGGESDKLVDRAGMPEKDWAKNSSRGEKPRISICSE